ncbi:MAG: hypothetical protein ACYTBZ_27835, partial [Planctomycetota bacterium]
MLYQQREGSEVSRYRGLLIPLLLAVVFCIPANHALATLPLNAIFSEDFNYPAGTDLTATAPWDGSATDEIEIDQASPWLKFIGGTGTPDAYHLMNYSGSGNVIFIHILVKPGTGTDTMWNLWFDDPVGNNLARWYGSASICRGRIGGTAVVTSSQHPLIAGQWNDLDLKIDTAANTSDFFCNGLHLGTLNHTADPSNVLGRIEFDRVNYSVATGHLIYFDELRVGEDPDIPINPPAAPTVTNPQAGSTVQTETALIQWTGDPHDMYEVHLSTNNDPAVGDGWDSGQQTGSANSCTSRFLSNNTRYYLFVRLHNSGGWGLWSAAGHYFDVSITLRIIPQPQEITWYPDTGFTVNAQTQIVIPVNPDDKDNLTADQLQRKVWDMTGHLPPIVQGAPGAPT